MNHSGTEAIFIIGSPRSGTSVLAYSLAAHEDLWTSAEADFLHGLFKNNFIFNTWNEIKNKDREINPWLVKNDVGFIEFSKYIGMGIDELFLSRSEGKRWIDAGPSNTTVAEQNALCFPNAKFIHMLRNGMSVVNSMIRSGFTTNWAASFEDACKAWVFYIKASEKIQKNHPERIMMVKYEELVDEPNGEFERIQKFLGTTLSDVSAEFMLSTRMNSSFSSQEERPKNPWDSWTYGQKEIFKRIAQETMERYSYPVPF